MSSDHCTYPVGKGLGYLICHHCRHQGHRGSIQCLGQNQLAHPKPNKDWCHYQSLRHLNNHPHPHRYWGHQLRCRQIHHRHRSRKVQKWRCCYFRRLPPKSFRERARRLLERLRPKEESRSCWQRSIRLLLHPLWG